MKRTAEKTSEMDRSVTYPSVDIAIIGAGPGGLYAAKRLKDSGKTPGKNFMVFDAMNRTGGRVRTLPIDGLPFVAEIGAMRYLDKSQFIINGLVGLMGLATNVHKVLQSDYYLRGKHVRPTNAGFGQRISYKN
jgi:protoporphyrinogen oxidase